MKNWRFLIIFLILGFTSLPAHACPKRVVAVLGDEIGVTALPILMAIYEEIGCSTRFDFLPGRRGILEFNKGQVDGELYRNPVAEQFYDRPFVRSRIPLIELSQGVFTAPDIADYQNTTIGYVSGIKWHDLFVQNKSHDTKRYVRFNSMTQLFDAYDQGRIKSFLSSDMAVGIHTKQHGFKITPRFDLLIGKLELYHYLGAEHKTTMEKISDYIEAHKPFDQLQK
ncbi:hypothetical protein RYZ26_10805 [Terasakiella sp. A23]|uniref:hypothetical protein n=1 Tax=Terasakiella sp. FCG-A23 TaxID=3080561 RepID=UPI00295517AC|nr:hypothetical protein [Terasakiella sp. A23]MDV7340084.1 hypothetical protein [Terasakiella sp. A23]